MTASWCELFRHFTGDGVDPFEVRRRAGRCGVHGLAVLDLTASGTRDTLEISHGDLVGDDYELCQMLPATPGSTD